MTESTTAPDAETAAGPIENIRRSEIARMTRQVVHSRLRWALPAPAAESGQEATEPAGRGRRDRGNGR
jgi:hypothetical protein